MREPMMHKHSMVRLLTTLLVALLLGGVFSDVAQAQRRRRPRRHRPAPTAETATPATDSADAGTATTPATTPNPAADEDRVLLDKMGLRLRDEPLTVAVERSRSPTG